MRIPESKLLALFKPLRITFFNENSHFVVFQSFKTSYSKQQNCPALAAILLLNQAQTHAIEACIFKYDVSKKNRSRNLNSVPHGPSNNSQSSQIRFSLQTTRYIENYARTFILIGWSEIQQTRRVSVKSAGIFARVSKEIDQH